MFERRGGRTERRKGRRMWFKKLWHLCLEWIRKEAEGSLGFIGNVWPWLEGERTCSLFTLLLAKTCGHVSGSRRTASGAVKPPTAWDKGIDTFLWLTQDLLCLFPLFNSCIVSELLDHFDPDGESYWFTPESEVYYLKERIMPNSWFSFVPGPGSRARQMTYYERVTGLCSPCMPCNSNFVVQKLCISGRDLIKHIWHVRANQISYGAPRGNYRAASSSQILTFTALSKNIFKPMF